MRTMDLNIFPALKDEDFRGKCQPPMQNLSANNPNDKRRPSFPERPDRLGYRLVLTSPSLDGFPGWLALPFQVDASQRCLRKNAPRPVTVCSTANATLTQLLPGLKAEVSAAEGF
jgi:hypothetical protein